jgi:hypothetical protein
VIELAIVGISNALCFWERPIYLMVSVAMLDVLHSPMHATVNLRPIYDSTAIWEGLAISIMGMGIFICEFVQVAIFKQRKKK